ncbi:MAG: NAD(P)H-dependent oxidoreductase subunit E [Bacteroidales bacterium]|nr:NAD(P)H-dependent oxidoreductase subunit E [Bacteroidales bacterium]MBQ9311985.1 NAD(P)H-dependent oxidoreductase subunit E [Bacteroidales bacterium]
MSKISLNSTKVEKIKEICASFGNKQGEIINILHKVQGTFGYLPKEVQEVISEEIRMPVAQIYGIVSFYSFFSMKPKGKYPISVCLGTACYVRDSEKILNEFKRQLGVGIGELTPDGKFSLDCLRCVGACGLAPVALVGDKVYGKLTIDKVKDILDEYQD